MSELCGHVGPYLKPDGMMATCDKPAGHKDGLHHGDAEAPGFESVAWAHCAPYPQGPFERVGNNRAVRKAGSHTQDEIEAVWRELGIVRLVGRDMSDECRLAAALLAERAERGRPPGQCGCGARWEIVLEGETTCVGFALGPTDPDGRVHYHDPNSVGLGYRCTAGHVLSAGGGGRYRCWCGWDARKR